MKLRGRLAVTLLGTAVMLFFAAAWAGRELTRRGEVQALRDFVQAEVSWRGPEQCEAAPESLFPVPPPRADVSGPGRPDRLPPPGVPGPWGRGGMGPPPRMPFETFVYDAEFRALRPDAPPVPDELRRAVAEGADFASRRVSGEGGKGEAVEVLLRTGWTGRCALVLARRHVRPPPVVAGFFLGMLPVLLILLVSVFVAAGPVVGRIRLLTEEVIHSAESRYEQPVQVRGKDEIAQLARAFNDAGTRVRAQIRMLEEREKALRAFLADTTHDLMIPLTVLQGHLDHLQKGIAGGALADPSVLLSAIQEAHYVGSLVHNLAAAAKLEGGETLVEFHAVDLGAVVERVVERHRPVAKPLGISIDFVVPEVPLLVEGDVTLLEQAVSNLVHNAVRYNRRGGHVAVALEDAPPGFRLEVIDDGPGISRNDLGRVFQRRERGGEARQRRPEGLGLGLHIARSVVERHGFDIRLESSTGGGVHVSITGRVYGAAGAEASGARS